MTQHLTKSYEKFDTKSKLEFGRQFWEILDDFWRFWIKKGGDSKVFQKLGSAQRSAGGQRKGGESIKLTLGFKVLDS